MRHRSILLGGLALAVLLPGFVACAREMSQPAASVPADKLAVTWRGFGMVGEKNGPIELKIANDGSFTGTAGGAVVSGKLEVGEGAITFESIGPKQGATGVLTYRESGGKAMLRASGQGRYAGTPLNFELTRVE
jgi:hypothetical protein